MTSVLESFVQTIANIMQIQGKAIQSMRVQMSQIVTSLHTVQKGKFPSFPEKNPT